MKIAMREAAFFEAIGRNDESAESGIDVENIGKPFFLKYLIVLRSGK